MALLITKLLPRLLINTKDAPIFYPLVISYCEKNDDSIYILSKK